MSLFKKSNILIIGDAMLDRYTFGNTNRISPEAPVPVVEMNQHENRLGGAANVALNLQSLGAETILCSVIGDDSQGILFNKLMQNANLTTKCILKTEGRNNLEPVQCYLSRQ